MSKQTTHGCEVALSTSHDIGPVVTPIYKVLSSFKLSVGPTSPRTSSISEPRPAFDAFSNKNFVTACESESMCGTDRKGMTQKRTTQMRMLGRNQHESDNDRNVLSGERSE